MGLAGWGGAAVLGRHSSMAAEAKRMTLPLLSAGPKRRRKKGEGWPRPPLGAALVMAARDR